MKTLSNNNRRAFGGPNRALTLMEMVIALAIMAVVFAAVLPQFRNIQNSWASRQGGSEALQNGRILIEHLNRNLEKAVQLKAVSDPTKTNGYIEYEATDGITYRYEVSEDEYVQFGPVGNLSELAGPVGRFNFTCYNAYDLDTPVTDVRIIRAVRVAIRLTNQAALGQDKNFTVMAYLRANALEGTILGSVSSFGITTGNTPALVKISDTHYLCAFTSTGDDGWAVVLEVDTAASTVSNAVPFEYDIVTGVNPFLARINMINYLCVYTGPQNDGWAVILKVEPFDWSITKGTPLEFEATNCLLPSLAQIDATRYLCTYTGPSSDGWAVVLETNVGIMSVSMGTPFEFDTDRGNATALARLDARHFLCAFQGPSARIWAVVLTVDPATWTITKETPFDFGLGYGKTPTLSQIDNDHFLCAYSGNEGNQDVGMAVVVAVDNFNWSISRASPVEYDSPRGNAPALVQMADRQHYLCLYKADMSKISVTVLTVDEGTWDITNDAPVAIVPWKGREGDLVKIDDFNYLGAFEDQVNKGWAMILNIGQVRP